MDPSISIIIPLYNKASSLTKVLDALEKQTVDSTFFEVVIVDDGSTDNISEIMHSLSLSSDIKYVYQENQGASVARNHGVSLTEGAILFFLDADITLNKNVLNTHLQIHGVADRLLVATRILPAIQNAGSLGDEFFQQNFDFGTEARSLHWRDIKTQALSVKKNHFFEIGPFDENLRRGQDIEFGYRAVQKGFEIRYCPQAVGIHNHQLDMRARCEMEKRNQRYLVAFFQKYPELIDEMPHLVDKWPIRWSQDSLSSVLRKMVRRSLATRPAISAMHLLWELLGQMSAPEQVMQSLYWKIIGSYQYLGLREGIEKYGL
jgi:glycosyltransferase involved in cell wall biosynthesis